MSDKMREICLIYGNIKGKELTVQRVQRFGTLNVDILD